ncbi:MAG: hypothetical protein WBM69_24295 [Desulfobacterales bacterium]
MIQNGDRKDRVKKRNVAKYNGIYFLGAVVFIYFLLFFCHPEKIKNSLKISADALIQILPSLLFIILFMGIMNYFVSPGAVSKYVGKGSGIKGWFLAIFTGILSHGPVYAWYPILRDLRNQGMKSGLIAAFLYNKAIKIPLLPLMVYYFGTRFVLIFTCYIVVASIVQGWIIQMIEK